MNGAIAPIDQVIVRKTGGYNLKSVAWWKALSPSEQMELIGDSSVQFFASGMEVDADVALIQLSPTGAAPASLPTPSGKRVDLVWPPNGVTPPPATYVRTVVEGPRWVVNKRMQHGEVEFYTLRGRSDASVYDLKKPLGVKLLSDDLLLDALGFGESHRHVAQEYPKAFEHFQQLIFVAHLGDRQWETTDAKIRSTLASNPYLQLVSQNDALAGY